MESNQEFTLDMLDEIENNYEEQEEIEIKLFTENGHKITKLKIDKYFNPKKIKLLIMELVQKIDILKNYTNEFNSSEIYRLWLMLLLTKYFTSLDIPKEFKRQLAVIEKLTDSTILFQIFSNFKQSEIKKVMDELDKQTHVFMAKMEAYEPLLKEVEADIQ
jgi:hypothetical protein